MPDPDIEIIRVDFDDADAVCQYLDMLDAYALDPMGAGQHLAAEVPLSTMRGYASDLRSLTQGRCTFVLQFRQYDLVPEEVEVDS